jgi:tRNA A-37 threonylcarbamoyl transferase component Bud32
MSPHDRHAQITVLVEGYLQQRDRPSLQVYLQSVDPSLREEVRAQCEEAGFIDDFFNRIPESIEPAPVPTSIGGCELLEPLGEGAMGEVHRARQQALQREVAVKLVRRELVHRKDFLLRFRREARVLASLDHPGIVKVLSFGEEQSFHYFVMELVRGQSLAALLPELRAGLRKDAAHGYDRIARLVAELLETLAYAHSRSVVHRDVKPSNVMVDEDDRTRLVDFGLAKAARVSAEDALRTVAGATIGTPAYLSPEIIGNRPHPAASVDLWAVAVVLHELLTGRLPHAANTVPTNDGSPQPGTLRIVDKEHDVPRPLARICERALAADLQERYPSAQSFAADLRGFLAREPVEAGRRNWTQWLVRHWRQKKRLYALAASAVAIVFAAALFTTHQNSVQHVLERVQAVVGMPPVASLPPQRRADAAATARALLRDPHLPREQRQAIAERLAELEEHARALHAEARAMITTGAGAPRGRGGEQPQAPVPALQSKGAVLATEAALVMPDLTPAATLLATAQPVLEIEAPVGRVSAPVRVDALDPITGNRLLTVETGMAPCQVPVAPGFYRIVLGETAAFAECTRAVGPPGVYPVSSLLRGSATAFDGMILAPTTTAVLGQQPGGAPFYTATPIEVAAFAIDRTEVTCGQFHDYCVAAGEPLPRTWNGAYDPAWEDLPVVGVSHAEAAAYAEWRGKRLPTWTEWQLAARSPAGWLYPWGDDAALLAEVPSVGGDRSLPWHQGVRPVGTVPRDVSWCGAFDMLGNILEWTETPYVASFEGTPFPIYPWRMCGGASYGTEINRHVCLDTMSPGPPGYDGVGFRCAKSINP